MSYTQNKYVRVFRSSQGNSYLAPSNVKIRGGNVYRYDGLYVITQVWMKKGVEATRQMKVCKDGDIPEEFTFCLTRLLENEKSNEELMRYIHQQQK